MKGLIAVADLNEDGKLDVAFPVTGKQDAAPPEHDGPDFLRRRDWKVSRRNTSNSREGNLTLVIATDLNKDGHLDLAVSKPDFGDRFRPFR